MKIKFTKIHGLGNDFILLKQEDLPFDDYSKLAIKLCNRYQCIGADGLVIVSGSDKADIQMQIINSDGSTAEMCGNAIRCFAKYVYENKIVEKSKFTVETLAGIMRPELIIENEEVTGVKVDMGKPFLERSEIPMTGTPGKVINEPLIVDNSTFYITTMLMNVPHTVVFVDKIENVDIIATGKKIENHAVFPKKTNVNFVQVLNKNEIVVRTWERGAGNTLACGTGACASAVASALNNKTGKKVRAHLGLGDLQIEWNEDETVLMTGSAKIVFTGEIDIN